MSAQTIQKLPAPRLQLRWVANTEGIKYSTIGRGEWLCHYELVIPLGKHDIRGEQEGARGGRRASLTELVIPMKEPSMRGSSGTPCTAQDGARYYDDPYRDGAHAQFDALVLGNPPIYVIAPDGMAFLKPNRTGSQP